MMKNVSEIKMCLIFVKNKAQDSNKGYVEYLNVLMILPQVHLRKPCYDFSIL